MALFYHTKWKTRSCFPLRRTSKSQRQRSSNIKFPESSVSIKRHLGTLFLHSVPFHFMYTEFTETTNFPCLCHICPTKVVGCRGDINKLTEKLKILKEKKKVKKKKPKCLCLTDLRILFIFTTSISCAYTPGASRAH